MTQISALTDKLDGINTNFYQKDFLLTWQHSVDELKAVLLAAEALEEMYKANISSRVFNGGIPGSNFRAHPPPTRFSFPHPASLPRLPLPAPSQGQPPIPPRQNV